MKLNIIINFIQTQTALYPSQLSSAFCLGIVEVTLSRWYAGSNPHGDAKYKLRFCRYLRSIGSCWTSRFEVRAGETLVLQMSTAPHWIISGSSAGDEQ